MRGREVNLTFRPSYETGWGVGSTAGVIAVAKLRGARLLHIYGRCVSAGRGVQERSVIRVTGRTSH
jgi:hypothetical protein